MSVGSVLEKVGEGVAKGAKAVGSAALPVLERTAQVVSGEAPQIDAEKRRQQYAQEDAEIAAKSQALEAQLEMGRKYGTLTPDQQSQYVDAISQLYSHPRHAGTLMTKLRQAIHPTGAVKTPPLPDATPQGGTLAADEKFAEIKRGVHPIPGVKPFKGADGQYYQPMYDAQGAVVNELVEGYRPPLNHQAGKSPPVPGNQLPPDAVGPDEQPIPQSARNAGQSIVEWGGAWYAAPKPKPTYKALGNDIYLMDPSTGLPMRKLGPKEGVKISTHQVPFPGVDSHGNPAMLMATLTSVTTPQGEVIDVEPGTTDSEQGSSQTPPASPKPKGVGGILPKTGAKSVTKAPGGVAAPVIPGSGAWARTKDPVFKADVSTYKKANDDVIAATKLDSLANQVASHPDDAVNQKRLVVALERQASGRYTEAARQYIVQNGWGNSIEQWANNVTTGALPKDVLRQMVDGAHQNLQASQDALKAAIPKTGQDAPNAPPAPIKITRDAQGRITGIE